MICSNALVGFLKSAAVRALPMEMLAPAAKVPSIRSSAMRLPPSSTTAMTPPGALLFLASAFAAAMICSAPESVSVCLLAVCERPFCEKTWSSTAKANTANMNLINFIMRTSSVAPRRTPMPRGAECVVAICPGELLYGSAKGCFAEIGLGPGAPDDHLGDVRHVSWDNDRLLKAVAERALQFQLVELIDDAVG